jgi:hypothetical protein
MNCKKVQMNLLFYLDNELTNGEKQTVEMHLSGCSACRKELQVLAKTQGMLINGLAKYSSESAPVWSWIVLEQRLSKLDKAKTGNNKNLLTSIKTFINWQPRWKPVLSGLLITALVAGCTIGIPILLTPSAGIQASQLAVNTPEITALSGGQPSNIETKVSGNTGYVLCESNTGESNLAFVDLQKKSVAKLFIIDVPPLTDEDKTQATGIIQADFNAGNILKNGGIISSLYPLQSHLKLDVIDNQPVIWTRSVTVGAILKVNDLQWLAKIDLGSHKVIDFSKIPPAAMFVPDSQLPPPYSREELIEIAKSDSRVSALCEDGAEVTRTAVGHKEMASSGAVILKLGDNVWSVRVDLNTRTVTRVELVPKAKNDKSNVFSTY